jgi:hypothetical protein
VVRHNPDLSMDTTEYPTSPKFIDLSGEVFGRLSVLAYAGRRFRHCYFLCRCECGEVVVALGLNLKCGRTLSCGCLHSERSSESSTTHGKTRDCHPTPEYRTWIGIKTRCFNPNYVEFHYYGGRGITVAPEWADSFERFLADMGPRPSSRHSIDRIDPNGHYAPGNCRWATASEQARNKRKTAP